MEGLPQKQENEHEKKHIEFKTAANEVDVILKEISNVFLHHSKEEAQKIVLEQWASKMDAALDKSKGALSAWLNAIS